MSYDSTITVTGYVGSEPRFFQGGPDAPDFVSFRLATTRSYFNRAKNTWVDGETIWFTVKAWRGLAKNINDSIAKGDALIVNGVLDTQKWTQQDGVARESLVIEAQSVGPNLTRGTAKFRPNRNTAATSESTDANSGFTQSTKNDATAFDAVAQSLTPAGAGLYTSENDESLTNSAKEEENLALTA